MSNDKNGVVDPPPCPHVAIIMDGSGRWATTRGLPRSEGHRAGRDAVRRTILRRARAGYSISDPLRFFHRQLGEAGARSGGADADLRELLSRGCPGSRGSGRANHRDRNGATACQDFARRNRGRRSRQRFKRENCLCGSPSTIPAATRSWPQHADSRKSGFSSDEEFVNLPRTKRMHPRACARHRSADPHGRRAAPEQLSALGNRLCRALFHALLVARFRRRRTRRCRG